MGKVDKMTSWHPFYLVWGDLEKAGKKQWKPDGITAPEDRKQAKRGEKFRSKMVQVKGVMPPEGGLTRQTPTGRAVGQFYE